MREICLEEISQDRNNNLNIIRFIAASMVIFSHAYPLGNGSLDILSRVTGGQIHFGNLAVCIFFFFAGFLIQRSVQKAKTGCAFWKTRCVRIFPELIMAVFLSAIVLGPCVTERNIAAYFTDIQTYKYLLNSLLILVHNLPGVFENNISGATVNGSLWTLPVEVICYVACFCIYKIRLSDEKRLRYTIPFFLIGYVGMYQILEGMTILQTALRPCGMFYLGMLYFTYRRRIKINGWWTVGCCLGLFLSTMIGVLEYGILLFLPYLLVYFAFGTGHKLSGFGKKYEISYGMYLCAFPIQQTVTMLWGGSMNPLLNFAVSMPFVLAAGWILSISDKYICKFVQGCI